MINRTAVGLGVLALAIAIFSAIIVSLGASRERAAVDRFERAVAELERDSSRDGHARVSKIRAALAREREHSARVEAEFTEYKDLTIAGMAVTGLLVAIAGIMLPAIQYISSILPGQKLLERAENIERTLEERFAELSARQLNDQIDRAIANLSSEDRNERLAGATHLALNAHYPFSRSQVADIVEVARADGDSPVPEMSRSVICRSKVPAVTRMFLDLVRDPKRSLVQVQSLALAHLEVTDSEELEESLVSRSMSGEKHGALNLLGTALIAAPKVFVRLANNKAFLQSMDRSLLASTLNNWLLGGSRSQIWDTELGRMFNVHENG
jgi:hypothetical protein